MTDITVEPWVCKGTMTTPQEEHYALIQARQFLVDLMDPKKTPRVPKYVREEASARVKHFPIMGGYIEKYGPHDHYHLEEQWTNNSNNI